jgi:hypothetical protein
MTAAVLAGLLCARRRLGRRSLAVAVVLPALAFLAGRRAGPPLAAAVGSNREAALATALGLGLTAALAGAVTALVAPRRRFLGPQLAAAPVSQAALFAVVTFVPLLLAGGAASVIEVAFLVPAFGADAPFALAAGWAGFALGAALADAVAGLRSSPVGGTALVGTAAGLWGLAAAGAGTGALFGPFGYLGLALRDEAAVVGTPGPALAAIVVLSLGLWGVAGAARPDEERPRGPVLVLLPVGPRPLAAGFAAALKRYGRRSDLRRATWAAAVVAGGAGLALAVYAGAAAVQLAGPLAVLGASVVPLAGAGIDREADWLWRAVPVRRWSTAATSGIAAVALGSAVVAVGVGPAAAWTRAPGSALLTVLAVTVFVLAAALIAGSLVPWRSDRQAEELATCVAFVGVAGGLWLALGRAAEALGGGTLATAVVLTAEGVLALAAAGALAERGAPC